MLIGTIVDYGCNVFFSQHMFGQKHKNETNCPKMH